MLELTVLQYVLSIIAGFLVGFSLGLIGGGGSILAIPLLLYFVGLAYLPGVSKNYIDHLVIGTTALAVGLNAYINAFIHWKKGNVRILEGIFFTLPGILGTYVGARVGLIVHGGLLLFLFGILMIVIAVMVFRGKDRPAISKTYPNGEPTKGLLQRVKLQRIIPIGFLVGFASGFFGIGGGFLIVPGLLFSTGICMIKAVGTSLISVGTFGITGALTYALAGEIDPIISILYLLGGIAGGYIGAKIASSMPRGMLRKVFAIIIIAVAIYIMYQNYYAIASII
ncbi:sulfite exporter TauE/SafE family protein [Sulfurisphaera ohwakuensis]|uniref:sulfite exporter TauE/SafE family protein n=1 Tax=Sulfurisphaera ohwakuensis TaxID=69656 RepID=UPI0036F22C54